MNRSVHRYTPSLSVHDPRALSARQVAYLRKTADGPVESLITRQHHDLAGRLVAQWDPRLFETAPKPNLASVYSLTGEPLKVDSVDAGWRVILPGVAGEELQRWDTRGHHWRNQYDDQLRLTAVAQNDQENVETFTYADACADPAFNR
ncbi:MAG: toxin, partial [Pseudomonas sp.]